MDVAVAGPSIIENECAQRRRASADARSRRRSSRRRSSSHLAAGDRDSRGVFGGRGRDSVRGGTLDGIGAERLSYIDTALEAVPGMTLKQFLAPVLRLHAKLLLRQRASSERLGSYLLPSDGGKSGTVNKRRRDAFTQLAAALANAAADTVVDAPLTIDAAALEELLQNKIEAVSYTADSVLALPSEPPEAMFVHIVVGGSVRATHYQPQFRRGAAPTTTTDASTTSTAGTGGGAAAAGARADRKQYYTSSGETLPLCTTGGLGAGVDGVAAIALAGLGGAQSVADVDALTLINDAASTSNMTAAIQRSLRKASRIVGQPTLQAVRSEVLRAPLVIGAAEALGFAPSRCVSYVATATAVNGVAGKTTEAAAAAGAGGGSVGTQYVAFTDVLRVRVLDVHAALLELARRERAARAASTVDPLDGEWFSAPVGSAPPRGFGRTVADHIAAARVRALSLYYPQSEVLMRQSWLLQDTPAPTLRNLISRLTARTYMPGEVVACPHLHTSVARQLCFLRRGRLLISGCPHDDERAAGPPQVPDAGTHVSASGGGAAATAAAGRCRICSDAGVASNRVLEVVHAGSSFGELSVLFGEPRSCTLVADSVCDVWCLSHVDFARTMRRDDALRTSLVEKAGALRIRWLAEQRFTAALGDHLRRHSDLLRSFPDAVLRLVQERVEPVVYSPGSLLTSTSQRCEDMIFIVQGRVESICAGVASYGAGDVLGEGCLVAHRWPLGLAARTMVEGWRLPRSKLIDALERAQTLHTHSGEVTSRAPVLLKQLFAPPVPEAESDVVGRLRMPVVEAAPGGLTYLAYARQVAEVQLKALCLLLRGYVRWEDINYATMDARDRAGTAAARMDAVAREYAVAKMYGDAPPSLAETIDQQTRADRARARTRQSVQEPSVEAPRRASLADVKAAAAAATAGAAAATTGELPAASGSGRAAAAAVRSSARSSGLAATAPASPVPSSRPARPGQPTRSRAARRSNNTGASAFLVSPSATTTPFSRRGPVTVDAARGKRCGSGSAAPAAALAASNPVPPRLRSLAYTLAERDRIMADEARRDEELERQLTARQTATVKEHLTSSVSGAATRGELLAPKQPAAARAPTSAAIAQTPSWADAASALLVSDPVVASGPLPPVHLFLSGDRPRSDISVAEAISVGYLMQLPDVQNIQSCVSFVDPDVTVGVPAQRPRRHAMAVTPNARFHKHNFLFAAAVLEHASSLERELQGIRLEEQTRQDKASALMRMMRASLHGGGPARTTGGSPGAATAGTPGEDTAVPFGATETFGSSAPGSGVYIEERLVSPSRERSPRGSDSRRHSPSMPGSSMSPTRGAVGSVAGLMGTPSPFRGSPRKSAAKKEEAFERLLRREPHRAMELLAAKHQLTERAGPVRSSVSGDGSRAPPLLNNSRTSDSAARVGGAAGEGGDGVDDDDARGFRRPPSLLARMADALHPAAPRSTERADEHGDKSDGGDGRAEEEVAMTDTPAQPPALAFANYRDRHHAHQAFHGALDGHSRTRPGSPRSLSTSALLLGAAPPATLQNFLVHRKDTVLFVDGYGALRVSPEAEAAGSIVIAPHTRDGDAGPSASGMAGEAAAGGSNGNTAAARARATSYSVTGTFSSSYLPFGAGPQTAGVGPLTPQDFVMPDVEDAAVVMRRIQRDVDGLNAVAEEQSRERRHARQRGLAASGDAAQVLSQPNTHETQVLEDWQRASERLSRDPVVPVTVPRALLPLAGPNYLQRGMAEINAAVAEEAARGASTLGVEAWQDAQLASAKLGTVAGAGGLVSAMSCGGTMDNTREEASTQAARRTIAAIGTGQLGYRAAPLVSPTQRIDAAQRQQWLRDSKAFFDLYKSDPAAVLRGEVADPFPVPTQLASARLPVLQPTFADRVSEEARPTPGPDAEEDVHTQIFWQQLREMQQAGGAVSATGTQEASSDKFAPWA